MNQSTDDLQVSFEFQPKGIFKITFKGESRSQEIILFKNSIDGHLNSGTEIKQAIFDLSEIDPVKNAAGRILDLACFYHHQLGIPIEVRLSDEIYGVLREITPKEMPEPRDSRANVLGVTVVVVAAPVMPLPVPQWKERYAPPQETTTVLACIGKVRAVRDQVVTVSLFKEDEDEEVIGEFNRSQFPGGQVEPGMIFDYEAVTHLGEGKTEIFISFRTEQQATDWDIVDDLQTIKKESGYPIDSTSHYRLLLGV
ncbi:MAG: hypothetical protein AAB676_20300, partial [Verrucomicrobiota bacterium]